ncbi:MAG TPA: hypothetical protein PKZ49_11250 [Nitrosomonas sp.]|nr:hypothetical protein [Nitrosomonas sp.]
MEKVNHNDSPASAWQMKNWLSFIAVVFFILASPIANSMDVSVKPISDKLKLQASETRWIRSCLVKY